MLIQLTPQEVEILRTMAADRIVTARRFVKAMDPHDAPDSVASAREDIEVCSKFIIKLGDRRHT